MPLRLPMYQTGVRLSQQIRYTGSAEAEEPVFRSLVLLRGLSLPRDLNGSRWLLHSK